MADIKLLVCLCAITVLVCLSESGQILDKRSFVSQGCMGLHDRSKFQKLRTVCDECYELFREPDIHGLCRSNCFKNDVFWRCVDALLLSDEKDELRDSMQIVYGK